MFEFRKGDVIEILKDTPELTNHEARHGTKASDWAVGLVERTQVKGSFPLNCVYAIPCVERPPEEFLVNQSCNTVFLTQAVTSIVRCTNVFGLVICTSGFFLENVLQHDEGELRDSASNARSCRHLTRDDWSSQQVRKGNARLNIFTQLHFLRFHLP